MVRAPASGHERAVLYINVAGLVDVAVANGSGCRFTRASAGGIETIASGMPLEACVIPAPEDVDAGRLTVAAGLAIAQRS